MKLTNQEVEHIATLARLRLTEEEKVKYSGQLSGIFDYVEKLSAVDTSNIEPTSQVTDLANVTRADEISDSGINEALLACAPQVASGFIVVPKIFDNK